MKKLQTLSRRAFSFLISLSQNEAADLVLNILKIIVKIFVVFWVPISIPLPYPLRLMVMAIVILALELHH